jgi:hypothetical protein
LNSSSVDISESFKALNDIKYHLTAITCLIKQFEMLFPLKKWWKKAPKLSKTTSGVTRALIGEGVYAYIRVLPD